MDTMLSDELGREEHIFAVSSSISCIGVDFGMHAPFAFGRQPFDLVSRRACNAEICERHTVMRSSYNPILAQTLPVSPRSLDEFSMSRCRIPGDFLANPAGFRCTFVACSKTASNVA